MSAEVANMTDDQEIDFVPLAAPAEPANDVAWLWTHCRALGMTRRSLSGSMRDDVALFVADQHEALAAAQPSAEPLTDERVARWQPIETAPKDETHILVSDGVRVSLGGWVTDVDHGADWEGQLGMAGWWSVDLGPNGNRPTHWMPLPRPPKDTP